MQFFDPRRRSRHLRRLIFLLLLFLCWRFVLFSFHFSKQFVCSMAGCAEETTKTSTGIHLFANKSYCLFLNFIVTVIVYFRRMGIKINIRVSSERENNVRQTSKLAQKIFLKISVVLAFLSDNFSLIFLDFFQRNSKRSFVVRMIIISLNHTRRSHTISHKANAHWAPAY